MDELAAPISIEKTSLRDVLDNTEPFKSFRDIASKENGIDVEGLSVWNKHLYAGFRGPVLRGNFVPVLRFQFSSPILNQEVLFVEMGGRGIRDLTTVDEGLLILAGPVGDGPGSYQLYLWNGEDMVPGIGAPVRKDTPGLVLIDDLPMPEEPTAKAEGLAIVGETIDEWEILIVFDGLKNGHATRYQVQKPPKHL